MRLTISYTGGLRKQVDLPRVGSAYAVGSDSDGLVTGKVVATQLESVSSGRIELEISPEDWPRAIAIQGG